MIHVASSWWYNAGDKRDRTRCMRPDEWMGENFLVEAIKVTFEDPLAHGRGFSAGSPTSIYAKRGRTSGPGAFGCEIWQF